MNTAKWFLIASSAVLLAACGEQKAQAPAPAPAPVATPAPAPAASVAPALAPVASTEAAKPADDGPVKHFKASGFSPAWTAEINGDSLTFEVPETSTPDSKGKTIKVNRTASAKSVEFDGMDGKVPVFVGISNGPCTKATDGGTPREFKATIGYGVAAYEGCADAVR